MVFEAMAAATVVLHLAFLTFTVGGAFLVRAARRRTLAVAHLVALAWGAVSLTVGVDCPLTNAEKALLRAAGETPYRGGFVDHYLEGVIYPEALTPVLWALAALAITVGYATRRTGTRSHHRPA